MKIYNTLSAQKEEFIPNDPNNVTIYACGPTVYNFFHIGNARCFTLFDMLRRYLEYRGYKVTFAQNFTDIDDKMIKRAAEENTTVAAVAEKYIGEYMKDAEGLGIKKATHHPRATENVAEIIEMVKTLVDKGYAYESNGDVYFQPGKFKGYGKLSHMNIDDLESGARIDISEQKKDPLDFALWKAYKPGEPYWESPWGKGRPGWHIECSAMSRKYLGETIDIHCGGQDLTFPHHENEIAQSEASSGKPFVKYWMHNGYINVDNAKMSKSLGNFFTVRDVAEKYGYAPIRFFLLSSHYRSPVNYSAEIIEQAKNALERIHNCDRSAKFYIDNLNDDNTVLTPEEAEQAKAFDARREQFITAMDDDFNTADGIAAIFDIVRDLNSLIASNPSAALARYAYNVFFELASLMGFVEEKADDGSEDWILEAIAQRTAAKKAKNYAEADRIRAELAEKGVVLEDTPQGTKYKINK